MRPLTFTDICGDDNVPVIGIEGKEKVMAAAEGTMNINRHMNRRMLFFILFTLRRSAAIVFASCAFNPAQRLVEYHQG